MNAIRSLTYGRPLKPKKYAEWRRQDRIGGKILKNFRHARGRYVASLLAHVIKS